MDHDQQITVFYSLLKFLYRFVCMADWLLLTALLYLLSWLPSAMTRYFYPPLFWTWSRHFVRALGIDLRLAQHNQKPLPSHFILIANHPSAFEDVGIPSLFNVFSLSKQSLRNWWVVGRISRAAGTIYVQREERESRRQAREALIERVQSGKNIALYPEGGCFGRRIQEHFHYGAFDISLQTGVPILPLFLHYEAQDDFEWGEETVMQMIWSFLTTQNNRATYHLYDAIDPKDFSDKDEYLHHVHRLYKSWEARYLD